jgi:hypothetical protein
LLEKDLLLLQDKYGVSSSELISILKKDDSVKIPLSIFRNETSPLESIVKFLKDNYFLKYSQIAKLLNRDQRTIWVTYSKAFSKNKDPFRITDEKIFFDIHLFSDRKISILESICAELSRQGHSITEIAGMLNKHRNTIGTAISRKTKKNDR